MALGNNSGGGRKFITIVGGKWTLRVSEDTAGATARKLTSGPNEGSEVHELYYDHIDGMIVGGEIKYGKFGTDICIDLDDEGESFTVQIPLQSSYFSVLAKVCPSIDVSKKIFLGLGYDKEKNRNFLYVKQDDKTIHACFTKADPNGMPEAFKELVMGKEKWNKQGHCNANEVAAQFDRASKFVTEYKWEVEYA